MKVIFKCYPVYNKRLNYTTVKKEFTLMPTFKERLAILFGLDISFTNNMDFKGITTVDESYSNDVSDINIL